MMADDDQRGARQHLPHPIEVLLQRRLAGLDGLQQLRDLAELGLHAGGDDQRPAAAVGGGGAGVDHVLPIGYRQFPRPPARAVCFSTGSDSPVSAASSICRLIASIRRASAGTLVARAAAG